MLNLSLFQFLKSMNDDDYTYMKTRIVVVPVEELELENATVPIG